MGTAAFGCPLSEARLVFAIPSIGSCKSGQTSRVVPCLRPGLSGPRFPTLANNARVEHPELWGFPKESWARTNFRGSVASILNLQTSLNHKGAS